MVRGLTLEVVLTMMLMSFLPISFELRNKVLGAVSPLIVTNFSNETCDTEKIREPSKAEMPIWKRMENMVLHLVLN